jgi:isoquinoline 1-oxidoreductase beta subunit
MGKWTRRAFVTTAVLAGGTLAIGIAIRPGDRRSRVAGLVAGEEETLLNVWVKISPGNTITAIVPHADMGQGVHTTLAMMLADELDADWSGVEMLEAPAHEEYANYALAKGYALGDKDFPSFLIDTVDGFFLKATQFMGLQITGGSTAVRTTGMVAMRVAGAATRAVLKQAAAEAWQVPVDELETKNSHVHHAASKRSAPYASFAAQAAELSVPPAPVLKSEKEFTIMGTDVQRMDIPAKVDGTAGFGIDVVLPGMKYAAVKAAPVFGDTIKSFDSASVQDMPGVRKVIDLGDAVAIVADGYWQARQAIDKITINYESGGNSNIEQSDIYTQFSNDMDAANTDGNRQIDFQTGNAEAALGASSKIVEAEYRVPYLAHATMEPMNCTAWVHDGRCELWTGTQNPLGFAKEAAEALDMDIENVILHNQLLGGGFGRRAFSDYTIQAARIASQLSYPVKLIWSEDNKPTSWINQYVEKHDPAEAPHIPYGIDNQLIHFAESKAHVPWGFWRSVDHSLHGFFTESFMDELAIAAGKDPYEFRHNLLDNAPKALPYSDHSAPSSHKSSR